MTKDQEYQAKYFLKSHPVTHHAKCRSAMCVRQRENARVPPSELYTTGKWGVCNDCETPYSSELLRCQCCSHVLRKRSKYRKKREAQVARY